MPVPLQKAKTKTNNERGGATPGRIRTGHEPKWSETSSLFKEEAITQSISILAWADKILLFHSFSGIDINYPTMGAKLPNTPTAKSKIICCPRKGYTLLVLNTSL